MTRTIMQRVGDKPFVGLVLTLVVILAYLAEIVFGLAWALRALEVTSVFDRWLPGFTAWELLGIVAVVVGVQWVLNHMIRAMQSPTFPFTG